MPTADRRKREEMLRQSASKIPKLSDFFATSSKESPNSSLTLVQSRSPEMPVTDIQSPGGPVANIQSPERPLADFCRPIQSPELQKEGAVLADIQSPEAEGPETDIQSPEGPELAEADIQSPERPVGLVDIQSTELQREGQVVDIRPPELQKGGAVVDNQSPEGPVPVAVADVGQEVSETGDLDPCSPGLAGGPQSLPASSEPPEGPQMHILCESICCTQGKPYHPSAEEIKRTSVTMETGKGKALKRRLCPVSIFSTYPWITYCLTRGDSFMLLL